MKKSLLILIALFIFAIGYSQTIGDQFILSSITYEITSIAPNTVKTIDYNTAGGTVVNIPASVPYNSANYDVTEIGLASFKNKALTNVTIPNSITSIATEAFSINQLVSITIPESVTYIGYLSFGNNQSTLTTVTSLSTTPPTIITGVNDSFGVRSNINLVIPLGSTGVYVTDAGALWTGFNTVSEIVAVGNTFVVDYITYEVTSATNNTIKAIDYDMAGGTVVNIPPTIPYSSITYNVTSIGYQAFVSNSLTDVTIPNSVTSIDVEAFRWNSLTNIVIPNSVIVIGNKAFMQNQLTTVTIPNSVTIIGNQVFQSNQLTTLTIPNSVTTIGIYAFADNLLTGVTIPNGITQISDGLFRNNQLTNIVIPSTITSIGPVSFSVNQLTNVIIPNNVISIEGDAFSNNQLTNVNMSNSVTNIGNYAFKNNQLTSIIIPNNVNTIGPGAFENNLLTDVYSERITPPIITTGGGIDTFAADRSNIHLHIPTGTMGAYVTDTGALWTGFNPVTEDALLNTSNFNLENEIKVITTLDWIKITYNNNVKFQNYSIYSISGVLITKGTKSEISTNFLTSGIYILKLDFDKGTFVKKFIAN